MYRPSLLIISGGTGRTGGDPAQSPWHRRSSGSWRPWRQGGRGTKSLRCPCTTWRLRGRHKAVCGSESVWAQAVEGRSAVSQQHPQKPFWQDPTEGTERRFVNVACRRLTTAQVLLPVPSSAVTAQFTLQQCGKDVPLWYSAHTLTYQQTRNLRSKEIIKNQGFRLHTDL